MADSHYDFDDLKYLMSRLRDPKTGCLWDIEQDYRSIVPHTLEEVYEVIEAIEKEDFENLSEELGDLLFQVVFYAEIAKEQDRFELDDVIHTLVSKLIYRHPHVFPAGTLMSQADQAQMSPQLVNNQWEQLKAKEKSLIDEAPVKVLDNVPHALPGMLRAKKLQKKAAKVGFDWPHIDDVMAKAREEMEELREAIDSGEQDHIEAELGDLLFVLANVARHKGIDPEQAIRRTNQKFESRFGFVEQNVEASGSGWHSFSLAELDVFWDQAKIVEKKS